MEARNHEGFSKKQGIYFDVNKPRRDAVRNGSFCGFYFREIFWRKING
jgi:hypothetical protein